MANNALNKISSQNKRKLAFQSKADARKTVELFDVEDFWIDETPTSRRGRGKVDRLGQHSNLELKA